MLYYVSVTILELKYEKRVAQIFSVKLMKAAVLNLCHFFQITHYKHLFQCTEGTIFGV